MSRALPNAVMNAGLGLLLLGGAGMPLARAAVDEPTLQALMAEASRLSGLPPAPALPRLTALSRDALRERQCPDEPRACLGLVAVYEPATAEVLHLDTLDAADPLQRSVLLHELVHHLQRQQRGAGLFASCRDIVMAEAQAYAVQNRYLAAQGVPQRVGQMLRHLRCVDGRTEPVFAPMGLPTAAR